MKRSWRAWMIGIIYFGVSYAILVWYTSGNLFCGNSRFVVAARLALACTIWDFVSSVCGLAVARSGVAPLRLAPIVRAIVVGAGVASLPFWIYRGFGVFLFQGTWADVSCVFTEGSGMAFPVVVAPALFLASFLAGWFGYPYVSKARALSARG